MRAHLHQLQQIQARLKQRIALVQVQRIVEQQLRTVIILALLLNVNILHQIITILETTAEHIRTRIADQIRVLHVLLEIRITDLLQRIVRLTIDHQVLQRTARLIIVLQVIQTDLQVRIDHQELRHVQVQADLRVVLGLLLQEEDLLEAVVLQVLKEDKHFAFRSDLLQTHI